MRTLAQILERQAAIKADLEDITSRSEPLDDDAARADTLLAEWDLLEDGPEGHPEEGRKALAHRATRLDAVRTATVTGTVERSTPNLIVRNSPFDALDDTTLRGRDLSKALIDGALRANEDRIDGTDQQRQFETLIKRHQSDTRWASNILARSREEYATGFSKLLTGDGHLLSEAERAALAVGTNTQGGYLVPTHLDPTLLITNAGSTNILRQYAKVVTLTTGNVWHGVTTAGVTASWDGETVEVSDDTWAPGTVSVTAYKGQSFVQASVEAFQDIASLASDTLMLFADAKDRLEGAAYMTGSGSSQPKGLFTAINASSSLQTTSTTAATIGEVDIHALYRALPLRFRGKGTFVANPLYTLAIKRLGTALSSSYTGNLTEPVSDRILGKPVIESDDAPTTQTTTALDQEVVFADLSSFLIVDMPGGTSIDFVPTLFNTANNLPDGRRGWHMFWRTGSDMVNLVGGRILVDKTSA